MDYISETETRKKNIMRVDAVYSAFRAVDGSDFYFKVKVMIFGKLFILLEEKRL